MAEVYDQPSNVDAEDGVVIVDGPGCVAFTFTVEAAEETSDRLLKAAAKAHLQRSSGNP
jgi:hypothetical protein